jgi:hypothetical protein
MIGGLQGIGRSWYMGREWATFRLGDVCSKIGRGEGIAAQAVCLLTKL